MQYKSIERERMIQCPVQLVITFRNNHKSSSMLTLYGKYVVASLGKRGRFGGGAYGTTDRA